MSARRVIRRWRWQRFASLKVIGQPAQLRDDSRLKLDVEKIDPKPMRSDKNDLPAAIGLRVPTSRLLRILKKLGATLSFSPLILVQPTRSNTASRLIEQRLGSLLFGV